MYTKHLKMGPRAGTWIRKEKQNKNPLISFFHSSRIDRKKDKTERKILDSQEQAFWDVHRPVVRKLCLALYFQFSLFLHLKEKTVFSHKRRLLLRKLLSFVKLLLPFTQIISVDLLVCISVLPFRKFIHEI